MPATAEDYRQRFTAFYESLTDVYPEQFAPGTAQRIGSTFRIPGAGGLDAQTFYMRHVLDLLFDDAALVEDLVTLARCAFHGRAMPDDAVQRVAGQDGLQETLFVATQAASGLTARIGSWSNGTDLFANILTNTDCALQMAGLYDHDAARRQRETEAAEGTMDQSAIDALFD